MSWKSSIALGEEGFERLPPDPNWPLDQLCTVTQVGKRLRGQLTDHYRRDTRDSWARVESGVELTPLSDLQLLRDTGRSPGEALFPCNLVKGLLSLRKLTNYRRNKLYDEEIESATVKREEPINGYKD